MNRISKIVIAAAIFILSINVFAGDKEIASKLDDFMQKLAKENLFSGTMLVSHDGNIVFEKAIGFTNINSHKENTTSTRFNIASIGKIFTKIMILQLREEGKLDFSDKLGKYFDFFPAEAADNITIAQLLDMTSGMGDYLMNKEYRTNITAYKNTLDLVKLISKDPLLFKPGTGKEYSNSGYAVLGGIIEKATGKDYISNLKERILDRLQMNSTGFLYRGDNDADASVGYLENIDGTFRSNEMMPTQPSPAGGSFSTVEDLWKLDNSIRNDEKILKESTKPWLLHEVSTAPDKSWADSKGDPTSGAAIAGGSPGVNALWNIRVGTGWTFIILSNYDKAAIRISKAVADIIKGNEYTMPSQPLGVTLYNVVKNEGAEHLKNNFDQIISYYGFQIDDDGVLNNTGYQFMEKNMLDAAIVIFSKNAELFPGVANCFDSLGEAYMNAGNYAEAKKNYTKVLEMMPNNQNAKKMLEEINKKLNN